MEIRDIKAHLGILTVLSSYHLKPDKNGMLPARLDVSSGCCGLLPMDVSWSLAIWCSSCSRPRSA
ncbi:MAG TPA: hypothetical protein VMW01_09320 [Williamwhitmania sp.]|nr:hypothetical protein [Williamwhitmania sp.]